MRRYIDYAFIWDLTIAIIVAIGIILLRPNLKVLFIIPKPENIHSFGISLITVSAALIGFLLTIITVIVTFKKGYEHQSENNLSAKEDNFKIPEKTIFEKPISKETKFYGAPIHKRVVDVFVWATYEIGVVLFVLLFIQFNVIDCSIFSISVINISLFIMLILTILRSLFIFRLFLNVHLHDKSLEKFT